HLPEPQNVLLDAELRRHFADVAKCFRRLRQGPSPLDCAVRLFRRVASSQTGVDFLLHDVAGPEDQHAPGRDGHLLPRLWVTPNALALAADAEGAKRGELHRLTRSQARRNLVQDQLDQLLGLIAWQPYLLHDRLCEIRTRERLATHDPAPSPLHPTVTDANCGIPGGQQQAAEIAHINQGGVDFYQRASAAPHVSPPPMASISTSRPSLKRWSSKAWLRASGMEAADVLPCLASV